MSINPYELLGVDVNSSLKELKKNYYELAMLMHPDRTGTDTTDEMIVLKNAYAFVKDEISKTNTTVSFEDLEEEFKKFCKLQEETIPLFHEIHDDRFDVDIFNTKYNEEAGPSVIDTNGYGSSMERSEYAPFGGSRPFGTHVDSEFATDVAYIDTEKTPVKNEFNTIIEYNALDGLDTYMSCVDYTRSNTNNYGGEDGTLTMTDYKEAFTPAKPIDLTMIIESNIKPIKTLEKEREKEDVEMEERSIPGIRWGHAGLQDENGNRLKDFLRLHAK